MKAILFILHEYAPGLKLEVQGGWKKGSEVKIDRKKGSLHIDTPERWIYNIRQSSIKRP